jgi:hypothetical protein
MRHRLKKLGITRHPRGFLGTRGAPIESLRASSRSVSANDLRSRSRSRAGVSRKLVRERRQRLARARNGQWQMTTDGLAERLGSTSHSGRIPRVSEHCHTRGVGEAWLAHALLAPVV